MAYYNGRRLYSQYYNGRQVHSVISSFVEQRIFGIKRNVTTSSPSWERIDNSIGKTVTASIGSSAGHSDFDNEPIFNEIKRVTIKDNNGNNEVMVKIPRFYYQRKVEGNIETIRISNKSDGGFALHPAFARPNRNIDYIYIGAYKTSNNHHSVAGVAPLVSLTRGQFRDGAKAKGNGWGIIDFSAYMAIATLMLVEFANYDVQVVIGNGYTDSNSSAINTGSCDSVPNLTGRPSGTAGKVDVVYRGIEGFWGNVWEWVDGFLWQNNSAYICNDTEKYNDSSVSNYTAVFSGLSVSSYIKKLGCNSNEPWAMFPTECVNTGAHNYVTDTIWTATDSTIREMRRGGLWSADEPWFQGLFYIDATSGENASGNHIGTRLLCLK